MNILIICLSIATLLISKTYCLPIETTQSYDLTTQGTTIATTITSTLSPEADREWEDLILGGPTVVNYLGLFMVLASRKDQVLTPASGYTIKYVQNVQSLRGILSQVLSAMQNAFEMARSDLVRTQNSMNHIPKHLKAALVLIQSAPKNLLSKLLSYTLHNIDRAATEGATIAQPTLERFVSVELLVEELAALLASTPSTAAENADYLMEAHAYATDIKIQWGLLVKLFRKFSERAEITYTHISSSFIEPIDKAQETNGFNSQSDRINQLNQLVPAAVVIDQSAYLLDTMVRAYTDISNDYMVNQTVSYKAYLGLTIEAARATSQRQLWQNIVSQSVKVARLTQERHNQFAGTSPDRQAEYAAHLEDVINNFI